jgi:prephenate dehydratase
MKKDSGTQIKPIISLGVSGEQGSFSEAAGRLYAANCHFSPEITYLTDMEGVLLALDQGTIEIGIFPVVNLRGGLVRMAFEAMGRYPFKIRDELWFEVHQCLLVLPGMQLKDIKKIVSHSQAIRQSKEYIATHLNHPELIEWQDTAKAARELSEGTLPEGSAVIAPELAASVYGLEILAKNIETDKPNLTAFIIVEKETYDRH